jgi:hypothetical protein
LTADDEGSTFDPMKGQKTCPRCGAPARPPGIWWTAWRCDEHGEIYPVTPPVLPTPEHLAQLTSGTRIPFWLPWPLPLGWLATGVKVARDEREAIHATVLACSGPNPAGGVGELLLVAEEPGVGLGARYAGIPGPDPGDAVGATAPHAKIHAAGHPTPLWWVTGAADRAVYVGEALGLWLWTILWPETAGLLMLEHIVLTDLRDAGHELDVPVGALSPRLAD